MNTPKLSDEQIRDLVRGIGMQFTAPDLRIARAVEAPLLARISEQALHLLSAQAQAQENHERAERLEAALADAQRDAGRYRWLKTSNWYVGPGDFYCDEAGGMNDYEDHNGQGLDAAIDAMKGEDHGN